MDVVDAFIPGPPIAKYAKKAKRKLDGKKPASDSADSGSQSRNDAGSGGTCTPNSFSADTLVLMGDGRYKKIKDLKPGDKVMAKDPKTSELKAKKVTHLLRHLKKEGWRSLEFSDGSTVEATDPHPFWEPELEEWVKAEDLTVGSQVETDEGERLTVTSIVAWTGFERSYNLTVADYHTYFVTQSDIWVHNDYKVPPKNLAGYPDAVRVKPISPYKGGKRARWQLPTGEFLEWDYQHGAVEKWDKKMKKHLGQFDPDTGEMQKEGEKGRRSGC